MRAWWCVLATACTAANPLYHPPDLAVGHDAGSPLDAAQATTLDGAVLDGAALDGAAPLDFANAVPDLTAPADLAKGAPCSGDTRGCTPTGSASLVCQGGALVTDRTCPGESTCSGGFCAPPPSGSGSIGQACDQGNSGPRENDCMPLLATDPTCAPFIVGGSASWVCSKPVGTGGVSTPCTQGKQCRTGFCGSNGTCFRSCRSNSDCPGLINGVTVQCRAVTITVEGQMVDASSCTPP